MDSNMTKSYLLSMINLQKGVGRVTESQIPDDVMIQSESEVDLIFFEESLNPKKAWDILEDSNDQRRPHLQYILRGACMFWALDLLMSLKYKGLYWSPVVLSNQNMGRISIEFQKNMPLFFFASGEARKFYQLLQMETPRQRAYRLCRYAMDIINNYNEKMEFSYIQWSNYQPRVRPSDGEWKNW